VSAFGELLSPELLETFECALGNVEAPILRRLRPGLSDDEIDALTDGLGLTVSDEARLWWRWHDGIAEPSGLDGSFGSDWFPLSLADAVAETRRQREFANHLTPDGHRSGGWELDWLALCATASFYRLAVDCQPQVSASRVAYVDPGVEAVFQPSLGALVGLWLRAWQDGYYFIVDSGVPGYRSPDEMQAYAGDMADFL
jgi:hypothetical protein